MNSFVRPLISAASAALAACVTGSVIAKAEQPRLPLSVSVLDVVTLDERSETGATLREISGIAWDSGAHKLYAVSDNRRLLHLSLDGLPDRIGNVSVAARLRLTKADGTPFAKAELNPEGVALVAAEAGPPAGPELWIVSEAPPRLVVFDVSGRHQRDIALPPALADAARLSDPKNGLEAVAVLPRIGYLTAPERPLAGEDRFRHTIFGAAGPLLYYTTEALARTSIKAIESIGESRIALLERTRSADDRTTTPFVRILEPARCTTDRPCTGRAARITLPGITDADFEGLAYLGGNRFLIASDDRIGGRIRTVLALIAVEGLKETP